MNTPTDWDQESHCTFPGCHMPATHHHLTGVASDGTPIYEMVCCKHSAGDQ